MPLFTRDNARDMARRANIVRWSRPKPAPFDPVNHPGIPDPTSKAVAQRTQEQLTALDEAIANLLQPGKPIDSEKLDELTKAKERLWKVFAHAAQVPQPGQRRPGRIPTSTQPIDLEPVPVVALPDHPEGISSQA